MNALESSDAELLRAAGSDAAAFARLRARYLDFVYAAAVRQSSDSHQAEDVTQAVFILLLQKSGSLADRDAVLAGWLLLTTRNVARNARRAQRRIEQRERKAASMRSEVDQPSVADSHRLAAVIDSAMAELKPADRDVIAERFFRLQPVTAVAAKLQISEAAATKRIARGLVRLRRVLVNLGITTTDAAVAIGLPAATAGSAPPALSQAPASPAAARLARSTARAAARPMLVGISAVVILALSAVIVAVHRTPSQAPPSTVMPVVDSNIDRTITLRLIDPASHTPIANATVSRVDENGTLPPEPAAADGTYTLTLPKPLTFYRAVCRAPGRVPMEMNFTEGAFRGDRPREYVIPMEPGTRIGGIVMSDVGEPLEGATVRVSNFLQDPMEGPQLALDEQVITDADGRWSFNLAPANLRPIMLELRRGSGPWLQPDTTLPPAKLRDETFTQRLDEHPGRSFDGLVTDTAGKPVSGAVIVFAEDRYEEHKPSGRTDATGHFHVADVDGNTIATVQAIGYSPQQQHVDARSPVAMTFKLQPANVLRGTIVDDAGQPISGVTVQIERWNDNRALNWSTLTDNAGVFTWSNVPADTLQIDASRDGYSGISDCDVKPGQPNRLVMHHPVQVTGTVIDADTHAPINQFKMTYGNRWRNFDDVTWQKQNQQTLTGGKYSATITWFNNGGKIRVDAEGYQPAISRMIAGNENAATVDFAMHKGAGPSGVVLSPDGKPLAGVRVIGVEGGTGLRLDPDSSDHLSERQNLRLATTDAGGAFTMSAFDGDSSKCHIVIDCAAGYADIDIAAFTAANHRVRLQRWGVLHGTYRRNGALAAGVPLILSKDSSSNSTPVRVERRTTTNVDGTFTFDNVPPGERCGLFQSVSLDGRSTRWVTIDYIKIEAGQSHIKSFGGKGRPVIGTLALPTGMPSDVSIDMQCEDDGPSAPLRKLFGSRSPPGEFVVFPDHTFHADEMLPGKYKLTVKVCTQITPEHLQQTQLAAATAELVVPSNPPCPTDVPVDMGSIEARATVK